MYESYLHTLTKHRLDGGVMKLYRNLHLFNLIEYGVPLSSVETLINNFKDSTFELSKVAYFLGDGEKTKRIIECYTQIDKAIISSYALSLSGISTLIVEKISQFEPILERLYDNLDEMSERLNLQTRTVQIIEDFCKVIFNRKRKIEPLKMKKRILEILSETSEPLTGTDIFGMMQNIDVMVNYNTIFDVISELHEQEVITFNPRGYKLRTPSIDQILINLPQYDRDLLSMKMQGYTLQSLAEKYQLSRQRILQKINLIISKMPIIQYEDRYARIYQQYNLELKDANFIFETDNTYSEKLYQYIQLKYTSRYTGDKVIDFLRDNNMLDSAFSKNLLLERGKLLFNGELIDNSFIELFKIFTTSNNILKINFETFNWFMKFLSAQNINIDFNPLEDKDVTFRKLENSGSFIRSRDVFINVELLKFDHEILNVFEHFLSTVSCLVSSELLIIDKKHELDKYDIRDKHELHAILKYFYASKYPDIKFTRTPHIEQNDYDKEAFIESLVEVAQPIEVNEFYNAVNQLTGIEPNTFAAYASKLLPKYIHNGIVESVKYELSFEEKDLILGIIKTPLISIGIFENMIKLSAKGKASIYSRTSVLEQIGYKKIGNIIVKDNYKSIEEAMDDWMAELPKVIDCREIYHYLDENYLKYRMRSLFSNMKIIWIDKESLLNTEKVLVRQELISFRNHLVELLPKGEIFTTHFLLKTLPYKDFINSFPSIKSFGQEFLTNVFKSHSEIYSNNGESTILRKSLNVKRDDLIISLIKKDIVVSTFDVRDKLLIDYGIDNIDISQSYVRELGFYYSEETQMIYINKEIYIKKVSDYLDE